MTEQNTTINDAPACIPRELQLQAAMFRLGDVDKEIHGGYEILKKHHKTVTVFGSARITENSPYYQDVDYSFDFNEVKDINQKTQEIIEFWYARWLERRLTTVDITKRLREFKTSELLLGNI